MTGLATGEGSTSFSSAASEEHIIDFFYPLVYDTMSPVLSTNIFSYFDNPLCFLNEQFLYWLWASPSFWLKCRLKSSNNICFRVCFSQTFAAGKLEPTYSEHDKYGECVHCISSSYSQLFVSFI